MHVLPVFLSDTSRVGMRTHLWHQCGQECCEKYVFLTSCTFCLLQTDVLIGACFFVVRFAETEFELPKVDKHFSLVPADLAGSLIDKFFQGSLSGRGWPNGSLTVLEPNAEYSYMGLEAISRCCNWIYWVGTKHLAFLSYNQRVICRLVVVSLALVISNNK